ncbi:chloramphenicol acetyltransferase [Paraclostridium bifermentans]|uniref:chloramphenicol acetyltransferase n=1 Tax=Paraclostridium bifermentans TaxID=1490 RepID=UPI0006B30228|nr:chloramphenicol acetyltransferase [Paraclostridium bifermentans]OSB10016.1 chloramphenicol acetyltransferase [Paraclostridium bifermentans]
MQYINFYTWSRQNHFKFFEKVDNPQFNICFNLNVTNFLKFVKENKLSFYYSMIYASTYIMNEIEDFRYKIRNGKIILHDKLQPSFTDMNKDENLFKIVTLDIGNSIIEFSNEAKQVSISQEEYFPETILNQDELIYFSCIPWISFTSISNEIVMNKEDSIPRISFGKYFNQDDKILIPYSIQVNHMLLDGVHVGKYIERLQQFLDEL